MSNAFLLTTGSNLPPDVPLQFTADDATVGIPVGNNYNIFSRQNSDFHDAGVNTTVDANGSDNHYVELTNRATGQVTTADATETTVITFDLGLTPATYFIDGAVSCIVGATGDGAAYDFKAAIKTDGATGTEIGSEYPNTFEDDSLMDADLDVQVSGNNLLVRVEGLAATSINWDAWFIYRKVV